MDSLQVSDDAAAAVAVAPRVSLDDIKACIGATYWFTADDVCVGADSNYDPDFEVPIAIEALGLLTICIVVMKNGFTVIGKSAPASPENFNAELGKRFAYEDAIRQLWPLMGFALRDKLASN